MHVTAAVSSWRLEDPELKGSLFHWKTYVQNNLDKGGRVGAGDGQRQLLLSLLSYPLIPTSLGGHWSAGVLAPMA